MDNWQFPDDDAGLADLKILVHHYYLNPPAMPRIIKLRAPWADAEEIIKEIEACPKRYTAKTLGSLLNLSGYEWRQCEIRTITPVDMTEEDMKDFIRVRRNGKQRLKRRLKRKQTREQYLASHTLSKDKPWEAEGISKATWYRRRTQVETSHDASKASLSMVSDLSHDRSSPTPMQINALAPPRQPMALSDLSNPMSALRYWSPGVPVEWRRAA
jgi:hypothetical protein